MNPSRIVGIAAVVALAATGAVLVAKDDPEVTLEGVSIAPVKAFAKSDIVHARKAESKVAWRDGGTKVYLVPVMLKDGGTGVDERLVAPCKRRPKGADGKLCMHVYTRMGIQGTRHVEEPAEELARFDAAEMVGPLCEPIACGLNQGDDFEADEGKPK